MDQFLRRAILAGIMLIALCTFSVPGTSAQSGLVKASPPPDSQLEGSPEAIQLTFSERPDLAASAVQIIDSLNRPVETEALRISEDDPETLILPLNRLLAPDTYTVIYTIPVSGEVIFSGSYRFTVLPPRPLLAFDTPADGAIFTSAEVPLSFTTRSTNLAEGADRIRIYLDGALLAETVESAYTLHDLEPGVYDIRAVIVNGEDIELQDTNNRLTIVIQDARAEERPGPPVSGGWTPARIGFGITILLLTAVGYGIGTKLRGQGGGA